MAHIYLQKNNYSKGMTALVTVLVIGAMLLLIAGSAAFQAYQENSANSKNIRLKEANVLAESGFDEAMLRLERDKTLSVTTTIGVDNSHYASVKIERNTPAIGQTTITSRGCSYNVERVIKSIVAIDDTTGLIRLVSQENIPATDNICMLGICTGYTIRCPGPAGGYIFYDKGSYSDGWRYLEATPSDQSTGATWGCFGTDISGAAGTAIGTGNQNTIDIMSGCATSGIAARLCGDLTFSGYSDWFLPSKDELNQIYVNLKAYSVGGLASYLYWTSSENSYNPATSAWVQNFGSGGTQGGEDNKSTGTPYVRCVHAF